MLEFGVDDYIVTPANASELQQMFGTPTLRVASATAPERSTGQENADVKVTPAPSSIDILHGLPLADVVLDALAHHPADAPAAAVRRISEVIAPTMQLALRTRRQTRAPGGREHAPPLSRPCRQ